MNDPGDVLAAAVEAFLAAKNEAMARVDLAHALDEYRQAKPKP